MPKDILIGIDVGTTALKAAAFDADGGDLLASASQRLRVTSAAEGAREQNAAALTLALRRTLGALEAELGSAWRRVAGLGLAAQGGSGAIVDRSTGKPSTPMVLWNDGRTFRYQACIGQMKAPRYWRALTLQDNPGAGLGRLAWMKEKHPHLFHNENIYCGAGEYLYFQLTGQWRQDAGNALQIGCYDAVRQRLVRGPMDLVGVPLSFVAPMREGHETNPLSAKASQLLRLAEGIPVAGPYMDHETGYLSAVGLSHRPLQCSLGTAWVGNFIIPEIAGDKAPLVLVMPAPLGKGQLIVLPLAAGNVA
ncbi:unnamed protein product, partial [marine sediment metagenome]